MSLQWWTNNKTNKSYKQLIYIHISCKCDTNRAGHFTLDAHASRPVACHFSLADNRIDLWCCFMMTSSNGSIFRVTGHLCEEFTGPGPVNSRHEGQWRGALMFPLICAWINGWVNNRKAGDLRRHRAHYDVGVMCKSFKKNSFILMKLSSLRISGARMLTFWILLQSLYLRPMTYKAIF